MILRQIYRPIRFLFLVLSLMLLVVACQTSSVEQFPTTASDSTSIDSDCRLVKHEMGETEVCGQPQRVAALSPHILDSILALGVQPAGFAQAVGPEVQTYDNPTAQIPYLGEQVTAKPIALGSIGSPSIERLTRLQPDLILGEKIANEDEYPLLTKIAPTLLFSDFKNPDKVQSWQQNIKEIAQALGKEVQVKELLAAHEEQIAQARTALQPVLQAYPRVFLVAANLRLTELESQPESSVGRLLQEIGFEIVRPKSFLDDRATISWEVLPQIETDLMIVMSQSDDLVSNPENVMPENAMQKKWAKKPLFRSMPVFQQGRVFFVDYYLWSGHFRGPLSDRLILEALPNLLLGSVEEAK